MEQRMHSPWPRVDMPEARPAYEPEMPWVTPPSSKPYQPDEGVDYWPEMVFPGPEGYPDDDTYNPVINPRRPPEKQPGQP